MDKVTGNSKYIDNFHPYLNCDDMNHYFTGIGEGISDSFNKNPLNWKNPECTNKFTFNIVPDESIIKGLSHLSNDSSLDLLDFDTKLLRLATPHIYKSLSYVINMSLMTGYIADDWRFARTTPVYKGKGCKKKKIRVIIDLFRSFAI